MIVIQATCLKIETMSDKSLRLRFETQETDEEQAKAIISAHGKFGWLVFNEKALTTIESLDLPDITPEFRGEKSPSERLRNTLFVYWKQMPEKPDEKKQDFEVFYRSKMEELINHFKERLT